MVYNRKSGENLQDAFQQTQITNLIIADFSSLWNIKAFYVRSPLDL